MAFTRLSVRVIPNARRNEHRPGEPITIRLSASPVEGKANAALIAYLADILHIRQSALTIERGHRNRDKVIRISGLDEREVRQRLGFT